MISKDNRPIAKITKGLQMGLACKKDTINESNVLGNMYSRIQMKRNRTK